MNELSEEIQNLNKISEIAGENASRALSKLIDKEIKLDLFDLRILPLEQLSKEMDKDEMAAVIYLNILGDIKGGIALIFEEKSAFELADFLCYRKPGETKNFDKMAESAIKETGNIIAGNYLTAFSNYLKIKLLESVPDMTLDSKKAIFNTIAVELSENMNEALISELQFSIEKTNIKGSIIVFFEDGSESKITKILKQKNK